MEVKEAGSPDSGYRSCSPQHCQIETELQRKEIDDSVLIEKPTSISATSTEYSSAIDQPKSSMSDYSDGKSTSCSATNIATTSRDAAAKRRRLNMEEENSSPVLGIRILPAQPITEGHDSTKKSAFTCRLCCASHEDAMSLAQHKCARIVNVRYSCEECGKTFGCPANLASHKRWHKPKDKMNSNSENQTKRRKMSASEPATPLTPFVNVQFPRVSHESVDVQKPDVSPCKPPSNQWKAIYPCLVCKRRFRRESNRRKHARVKHGISIAADQTKRKIEQPEDSGEDTSSRESASPYQEANGSPSSDLPSSSIHDMHRSPFHDIRGSSPRGIRGSSPDDNRGLSIKEIRGKQSPLVVSSTKCTLSTLALAAEVLNKDCFLVKDFSPYKRAIHQSRDTNTDFPLLKKAINDVTIESDPNKPLDLSVKSKPGKLRHSIDEITKPTSKVEFSRQIPSPNSEAFPKKLQFPNYPMLQGLPPAYIPVPPMLLQNPKSFGTFSQPLPWSATPPHIFHDKYLTSLSPYAQISKHRM